jgi:hypothetical protein
LYPRGSEEEPFRPGECILNLAIAARRKVLPSLFNLVCFSLLSVQASGAQQPQENSQSRYFIERVELIGNLSIETETLLTRISSRPGDPYSVEAVRRDVQALRSTQFFDDVRFEVEDSRDKPNGKIVMFSVKEKSDIARIATPQTQAETNRQLEVRLTPLKKATRAGQPLEVRVEIRNISPATFFVEKAIYESCGPFSPLSLRLELGPPMKPQLGHGCASDCIWDSKDTFARKLVTAWTSLPAGNFYGTVISMNPDEFPQLNTPGRWRLRGTYKSTGDLSTEYCFDIHPVPNNKELIEDLPYKARRGQVDTNTVWIEILPRVDSSTTKKSP